MTASHPPIRPVTGCPLWVGPAVALEHPAAVCDAGIEAVVCVAAELLPRNWPRDLTFVRIPLSDDGENLTNTLQRAVDVVHGLLRDEVPTLVVCSMGHSRSIAVVAASIAVHRGITADDALREITADLPSDVSPELWNALRKLVGD